MAPLTNELIAGVWDAGRWDWKQKKTVCHKMTMLDEIRRERACELFGEGFRLDDLKRWGEAKDHLTGTILGRHVLNTAYTKHKTNDVSYYGEPCYYPEKYYCGQYLKYIMRVSFYHNQSFKLIGDKDYALLNFLCFKNPSMNGFNPPSITD